MTKEFDPADPKLLAIHQERIIRRDIDQLLGICEFALQDGHIDQAEAEAILEWLNNHTSSLDTWPANVLYDRLRAMLADNVLDDDEQGELLGLIMSISRPRTAATASPATLPLCQPQPNVVFESKTFCFTGVFEYGSREKCHAATQARGGILLKGITKKLHYLVIGNVGSETWLHSTFGHKVLKAVEYRTNGVPIAIISETTWRAAMSMHP